MAYSICEQKIVNKAALANLSGISAIPQSATAPSHTSTTESIASKSRSASTRTVIGAFEMPQSNGISNTYANGGWCAW